MTPNGRKSVAAVPCPHCHYAYTRAVYGQAHKRGYRRRRECVKCERGFITFERYTKDDTSDHQKT